MRKRSTAAFVFVAVPLLALSVFAFAADSNIGTWKLNVAKSKYSPGPAPQSQTLKIEASGTNGVKYTADGAVRTASRPTGNSRPSTTARTIRSRATRMPT